MSAALVLSLPLGGCGGDKDAPADPEVVVSKSELREALDSTGFEIHFKDLPKVAGAEDAIAGTASNNSGASVDFVIVLADPGKEPKIPSVPGADSSTVRSLGNVQYLDNASADSAAQRKERVGIGLEIEQALWGKMPAFDNVGP